MTIDKEFEAWFSSWLIGAPSLVGQHALASEAWQAATEQSQKEIEELKAREKELVEALRYVNKELIMYGYQYESKDSINVVLNEALANVRGE